MELWAAMLALFVFVFLKAFQQRNVAFDHYWPVLPISICMAACEFYVIAYVVSEGYDLVKVLAIGSAGGTGTLIAMLLHKRIFSRGQGFQVKDAEDQGAQGSVSDTNLGTASTSPKGRRS